MIVRETNDNGEEVSIVIEQVVAWKCAHKRITVYVGSHNFAFFGEAAGRMESKLRTHLGEVAGSLVPPGSAGAAA
jgi:hypothetical protein